MRSIRTVLALLFLVAPVLIATQPAAANAGIPVAGPCLMNATVTYLPNHVGVNASGTCTLNGITAPAQFTANADTTLPASCVAAVGIGTGTFAVQGPFGINATLT